MIGTSSGATAAAQVRSGIPPAELLASVLSPPVQPVGQNREQPPSLPMATVFERMRAIGAAATSAADLQRAMGAFGLECDSILGPGAGQRRAMVAARLPRHEWPDRPMIVVAVDAHTGELATFDRDSGVDLVDAVTASTALPGSVPTVSINGTRYINGGVRSPDNADLASGYANVVVLSPFGGRSGTPAGRPVRGPAQTTGMGHGPGGPGRGPAQAGQPRRGDHAGRRFPSRNGHEPDGSGDPHSLRPCRIRPRQAGSDPNDVPLTIARRGRAIHGSCGEPEVRPPAATPGRASSCRLFSSIRMSAGGPQRCPLTRQWDVSVIEGKFYDPLKLNLRQNEAALEVSSHV